LPRSPELQFSLNSWDEPGTCGSLLATQETEIRRTTVGSQPGQIVLKTLSQKNPSHKKLWISTSFVARIYRSESLVSVFPS
jgi:hypothetical protein